VSALLVYVFWNVRAARDRATAAECFSRLEMIGMALSNYERVHGSFPPAYIADATGKPMHSWRVLILPYLNCRELYSQYRFDEPWNSEHNRRLALQMPDPYRCPADPDKHGTRTSYLAVVGAHAAWHGDRGITDAEIGDASAHFNTIMLVETKEPQIDWIEPRDMSFEDAASGVNASAKVGISSRHPHGAKCLTTDCVAHFLDDGMSQTLLRWLLTVAPNEKKESGSWPGVMFQGKFTTDEKGNDASQNGGESKK
jgi:hypothetical protein